MKKKAFKYRTEQIEKMEKERKLRVWSDQIDVFLKE